MMAMLMRIVQALLALCVSYLLATELSEIDYSRLNFLRSVIGIGSIAMITDFHIVIHRFRHYSIINTLVTSIILARLILSLTVLVFVYWFISPEIYEYIFILL